MAQPVVDFWFEFASTYSYPAACRIGEVAREAGVQVRFRPFLLGPIFKAQGWDSTPFLAIEDKGRNMWRDVERVCADLGLPFRRPDPFPQNGLYAARVALVGLAEGWGEAFCVAVYRAEFAEGRQIADADVLADIAGRLGVDGPSAIKRAQQPETKDKLRRQNEEAKQLGIYGAPSFVTRDGELFWGNDRLERALRWAKERG